MRRLAATLSVAVLAGCGGGHQVGPAARAVGLPPANPLAVTKMVQGVNASKEPAGQTRAAGLFKEAIAIDPNLWEARYDLGVVLAQSGDLANAEQQLHAAAKLAPDASDVVVALAEVERRRGENKAAADTLGDFLSTHPQDVGARALYVAALRSSGQVEKAIGQARELLMKKPGDASALAELALCHLAKGERETASLLAKQALEANPKSAVAHRATGLIELTQGEDALAFQAFSKATEEDPRDTTARLDMGGVLLRAGAYAKAEEQYRAILELSPDDADAQLGLAAALRGQGETKSPAKWEEARALLEKILAKDAHDVSALFNLGVLYADFLKKPAEARPLFKRFLDDAPGDHPARAQAEKYLAALKDVPAAPAPAPAPAPAAAAPAPASPAPAPPSPAGGAK